MGLFSPIYDYEYIIGIIILYYILYENIVNGLKITLGDIEF